MSRTPRTTGLLMLLVIAAAGAAGAAEPAEGFDDAALLVIDVQAFYFPGGQLPLAAPEAAAANAAKLIQCFRSAGRPVIHVQHLPEGVEVPDATGLDPQYRIHPSVLPAQGETLIGKHHANAFRDTRLLEVLRGLGIRRLVVSGMQTHMCVEAAVRAAADLGYEVIVVADACATRELEFGGTRVPAAQVHAAALATMRSSYAEVLSAAEVCEGAP